MMLNIILINKNNFILKITNNIDIMIYNKVIKKNQLYYFFLNLFIKIYI